MEDILDSFPDWGPIAGIAMMLAGLIGLLITLITKGCLNCS